MVYINRISKFLPNTVITNEEMEDYLGLVNGKKSKARALVLRSNGIKNRYYAMDKNGVSTHSNAEMTTLAIKDLCDENFKTEDIELLCCGSATPDQTLPSHASMVHGELADTNREIVSFMGSCLAGINALKYGYLSILAGNTKNAVVSGSEKYSSYMKANQFDPEIENLIALEENPYLAFEKDFLRWMLSDGAGALLMQDKPNETGISLRIDWVEMDSFGHELDTCMYSGSVKMEDGSVKGWSVMTPEEREQQSVFSIKQDVKLLGENIVPFGYKMLERLFVKRKFTVDEIDWFLPHLSSHFFKDKIYDILIEHNNKIPYERWFLNLAEVGNVGSASAYLMLEELFASDKLKKGQKILIMIPESARFSYGYIHLTVV